MWPRRWAFEQLLDWDRPKHAVAAGEVVIPLQLWQVARVFFLGYVDISLDGCPFAEG